MGTASITWLWANTWQAAQHSTYLAVHVILSLNEFPAIHFPCVGLAGDNVAFCFVQDFNWHPDGHGSS